MLQKLAQYNRPQPTTEFAQIIHTRCSVYAQLRSECFHVNEQAEKKNAC